MTNEEIAQAVVHIQQRLLFAHTLKCDSVEELRLKAAWNSWALSEDSKIKRCERCHTNWSYIYSVCVPCRTRHQRR